MKITTRLFSTVTALLLLSFTLGLIVAPSVLGLASVVDIGGTSGADINARYIAANQFQFNDTNILQITVNGTARYITFPNNTGTVVYRNSSDTLTNKVLTSPTLTSPVISTSALFGSGTTLKVNSGGQPTFLTVTYGARVGALALNNSYPITGANLTAPIFSGTATTAGTFTMPAFTAAGIITLNSGSAIKVSGGGSPTLFTPTYGARVGSIALNNSYPLTGANLTAPIFSGTATTAGTFTMSAFTAGGTVDGASQAFNNLGAAGNDFGATNTLVATTFSGDVDLSANDLIDLVSLQGSVGNYDLTLLAGRNAANTGNALFFQTLDQNDVATNRLYFSGGAATAIATWNAVTHTGLVLSGLMDFAGYAATNVGAAGNDFGATNTLVATTFSSTVTLASGQAVKVSSGGVPTLFTPTYGASTITWAWNSSVAHTGLTLGGALDANGQALNGAGDISFNTGADRVISINSNTNRIRFSTGNAVPTLTPRIDILGGSAIVDIDIMNANLDLNGNSLIGVPNGSTGAGSASLGANSPAVTLTAPATWIPVTLANSTVVYIPAWK